MEDLKTQFYNTAKEIESALPRVESLSKEEARAIIRRYTAAIEGNFVAWMGATVITTRSLQARYASAENLWVEMKDNHAGMLHEFAKSANALPNEGDYVSVESVVGEIRALVSRMSGLKNLTLMATLESTSAVFIPWLAELAKCCGSKNLKYTDVHGEADIKHAEQFIWALEYERMEYESVDLEIKNTIDLTKKFLLSLFTTI